MVSGAEVAAAPDLPVPAEELGPGALHRHRRRGHVRHRADHAGPRAAGERQRRQGLGRPWPRCARSAPTVHVGHRAENVGERRHRGRVHRDPASPTPSWSRPAAAGCAVVHRAGALASVMVGRRAVAVAGHARQDDDDLAAHGGHPALRRRPVVRDRRQPQRVRGQRAQRVRRRVRRRGRRERRLVPALLADRRGRHQRRAGPPRPLRHRRRRSPPRSTRSPAGSSPAASWSPAPTTRARVALAADGRAAAGVDVRTYGEAPDADLRLVDLETRGLGSSFEAVLLRPPARPGRAADARPAQRAQRRGGAAGRASGSGFPAERLREGLASFTGTRRRFEHKGTADGVRVFDSYAHHPTELTADLAAAREVVGGGRVVVVFQPHLFSRTRLFADRVRRRRSGWPTRSS